jgi:hypothetical protein
MPFFLPEKRLRAAGQELLRIIVMLVCVREGRFPGVAVTQYCMSGYSLSDDSRVIAELMPIISRTSSIASTKRTSQSTIHYLGREAHARLEIVRL